MSSFEKLGVIGAGNMGQALVQGVVPSAWSPQDLWVFDVRSEAVQQLQGRIDGDINVADSVRDLAANTDVLLLSVKPKDVAPALSDVRNTAVHLISIAAGVSLSTLHQHVGSGSQVIRVMPNTPAQVGMGMSFLAPDESVEEPFLETARTILGAVGQTEVVDEDDMDAVTALSGSGPAYVFYLIESLREAGIYLGLSPEIALKAAIQTVRGSAELAGRVDQDPSSLRLDVSSPGGTTVEAIKYFDEVGLKGSVVEAVRRACEKSRSMD